jgi:hypothetical protein
MHMLGRKVQPGRARSRRVRPRKQFRVCKNRALRIAPPPTKAALLVAEFALEPRLHFFAMHRVGVTTINAAEHSLAVTFRQYQLHRPLALWADGRIGLNLGHRSLTLDQGERKALSHRWLPKGRAVIMQPTRIMFGWRHSGPRPGSLARDRPQVYTASMVELSNTILLEVEVVQRDIYSWEWRVFTDGHVYERGFAESLPGARRAGNTARFLIFASGQYLGK